MKISKNSTRVTINLAIAAIFAALVWVATITFTVAVPATTGYFNIGETVIYVAALSFGGLVGAFAGGVGAALADIMLAPSYAPGTLVVKGIEGAIVGYLNKKLPLSSKISWRIFTAILGILVGVLLAITGSIYYSGEVQLYLGYPVPASPTFVLTVPVEFWYALGAVTMLSIILAGFKMAPELGRAVFSVITGGIEMVVGYFLYEQIILGKTTAIVEIPVNIGQMLIGLIVAIPITKIVLRSLPQLKS